MNEADEGCTLPYRFQTSHTLLLTPNLNVLSESCTCARFVCGVSQMRVHVQGGQPLHLLLTAQSAGVYLSHPHPPNSSNIFRTRMYGYTRNQANELWIGVGPRVRSGAINIVVSIYYSCICLFWFLLIKFVDICFNYLFYFIYLHF